MLVRVSVARGKQRKPRACWRHGMVVLAVILVGGCGDGREEATTWRIVFDGQSLNNLPDPPENFPSLVIAELEIPGRVVALNAVSWTVLAASAPWRLYPEARLADRTILVMQGGQADLTAEEDSGRRLYEQEADYATAARAAGFDFVIGTTIPRAWLLLTGTQPAERMAHNRLLLADPAGAFDAIVDLAGDPRLTDPKGPGFVDGLHFSASGARVAADLIEPVVASILAKG